MARKDHQTRPKAHPQSFLEFQLMGNLTSTLAAIPCLSVSSNDDDCQSQEQHERTYTPSFVSSGDLYDHPGWIDHLYNSPATSATTAYSESVTATADSCEGNFTEWPNTSNTEAAIPIPLAHYPDRQSFPIVHATCTARSTRFGRHPSFYLYDDTPSNPLVHHPMLLRLREPEDEDRDDIWGHTTGVRSINHSGVEFWIVGKIGLVSIPVCLVVPHTRAYVSRAQAQAYHNIHFWIPAAVNNNAQYRALVDFAKGHHTDVPGKSSSMPDLSQTGRRTTSLIEVPSPAHVRVTQPQCGPHHH